MGQKKNLIHCLVQASWLLHINGAECDVLLRTTCEAMRHRSFVLSAFKCCNTCQMPFFLAACNFDLTGKTGWFCPEDAVNCKVSLHFAVCPTALECEKRSTLDCLSSDLFSATLMIQEVENVGWREQRLQRSGKPCLARIDSSNLSRGRPVGLLLKGRKTAQLRSKTTSSSTTQKVKVFLKAKNGSATL